VATSLYLTTGDGFARLVEDERGWRVSRGLEGTGAQCLAVDPRDPRRLFVGCRGAGLQRSDDAGERWADMGLPATDVFSVAVSPVDGALYAGTEPSMLFRRRDDRDGWEKLDALERIPSAPRWSFPPRPWTSHVRWIAPSPHDADVLLVGIELGGLMYTDDGGRTFSDHRPGAARDVHALAWHPREPGRAYEAAGDGAAWSRDGGLSWQPLEEGLSKRYTWGLAVDPEDADRWYVSAAPGPRQAHGAGTTDAELYRWRGSGPWERLEGGLPRPFHAFPYALATASGALYAGLGDGSILRSTDGGDTWERLPVEVGSISALTPA
jgi:hypothetical protein